MLWVFSRSASVLDIFMEKIEKYQKFLNEKKKKENLSREVLQNIYTSYNLRHMDKNTYYCQ